MSLTAAVEAQFAVLRDTADRRVVQAIEACVLTCPDRALSRINALAFAAEHGLDEEPTIAGFLHAARLGIVELSWNILCPGCGGVLDSGISLKIVSPDQYTCSLCAAGYEPTLDEMVEVTFTVSARVRKIAAHDPGSLSTWDYYRQVFWGSGIDLPDDAEFSRLIERIVLEDAELQPGEKAFISLTLPAAFVIIFDPVVHMAQFVDVEGEPTQERQSFSFVLTREHAPTGTIKMRPGPLRLSLENRSTSRALPSIWIAGQELHDLLGKRRPFLTANRLLSNQTFRDIYRTDTIDIDQRLKITSLTFLFTDLKGSTELYDRVGDLAAYEIVRSHFRVLTEIVAAEAGAVVKTIGDAVMATFTTPDRAIRAAIRMREAMAGLRDGMVLKIGIHEGACLAVMLNERQDYFGQAVNIAARVQGLATTQSIYATERVVGYADASRFLSDSKISPIPQQHALRGIAGQLLVYEIP
jgi:class 3 adenylate cyclase